MTVVESRLRAIEPLDANAAVVRIVGLTKRYGRTVAVQDLDLALHPGEVVGFLGPNGAGKTTVLRVLTGALQPSSGLATVMGFDPFRDPVRAHRNLGYLPGDLHLPLHMTGRQFLDFVMDLRGDCAPDRERLVSVLEVPLQPRIGSLSKGNRQKIGVVQALMSRPRVLLLDEPSSGLDPLAQEVLDAEIRRTAERGAAVLLSSHLLKEAEEVVDRVVLLRAGKLIASSTLDELRAEAPYHVELEASSASVAALVALAGVRAIHTGGRRTQLSVVSTALPELLRVLSQAGVRDLHIAPPDLESVFLSYYEGPGRS